MIMFLFSVKNKKFFIATAIVLGCLFVLTARAEEGEEAPPPPPPAPVIIINNPDTSFPEQVKTVTAAASRGVLTWQMLTDSSQACNASVQDFMLYEPVEFDDSQNGYRACFRAVDELGQTTYAVSNVITNVDNVIPDLSLRGGAEVIIYLGEFYGDAGATAVDNFDGAVPVYSIGTVDTNTVGTYYIVYNTVDRAGNVASGLTRTIRVQARPVIADNTNNQTNNTTAANQTNQTNQQTINTSTAAKFIYCSSITYGDWLPCADGLQFRAVATKSPVNCLLSSAQQAATSRTCQISPVSQVNYCVNVFYGKWNACANGKQTRKITSQVPVGCIITAHQELFKSKTCAVVLGQKELALMTVKSAPTKTYADGSLLRGFDKKIYVLIKGQRSHITTIKELAKYRGRKIYDVSDEVINQYPI